MTGGIRHNSLTGVTLAALILCGSTALRSQQPAAPAPNQDDVLKNNVQTFELLLKRSILNAGAKVAEWASQINPNVVLNFVADPEVRAVPLMDNSLVFHVDVAEIGVSSALWYQSALQKGLIVAPGTGAASRVGGTPVSPDPIKASTPVGMTPSQYLTELVREGLIDTILDNSNVLPLRPGQTLYVACSPVDRMVTNPLYRNQSKKLVLFIKAEDLLALRQGLISREETKQRIAERRF